MESLPPEAACAQAPDLPPGERLAELILRTAFAVVTYWRCRNADDIASSVAEDVLEELCRMRGEYSTGSRFDELAMELALGLSVRGLVLWMIRRRACRLLRRRRKEDQGTKQAPEERSEVERGQKTSRPLKPRVEKLSAEEAIDNQDLLDAIEVAVQVDWRARAAREVMKLSVELDLPYSEICAALGLAEPTFRNWRKRLREVVQRLAG